MNDEQAAFKLNMLYPKQWPYLTVLLALIILFPLIFPSDYLITVATLTGIYTMITIGLSLLLGYTGQISLGHAAYFGLGAYTSGILTAKFGLSPWLALLIALMLTLVVAYLIGKPTLKLKGHYLALATVAFNIIVYTFFVSFYTLTGGASGLTGIPKLSLFGFTLTSHVAYYFLVWLVVLGIFLFSLNIVHSPVGRVLRGIHDSEIATIIQGVDVSKYKIQVFVLSAVFASLAGSLYAHFVNFIAPPTFYVTKSIMFLMMVVIGGAHSLWGALLGAIIITVLGESIGLFIPQSLHTGGEVELIFYGLMLILVIMFLPKGLIGLLTMVRDSLMHRFTPGKKEMPDRTVSPNEYSDLGRS